LDRRGDQKFESAVLDYAGEGREGQGGRRKRKRLGGAIGSRLF